MKFTLHIWRQENARAKGHFETYPLEGISPDCSFLEMLDILNEQLINDHIAHPVCFDNDCREGICGMCGLYINGRPHGNDDGITTCQLHMRKFGAPSRSLSFATLWWTVPPSTRSSKREATSAPPQVVCLMPTRFRFRSIKPTWPWMPHPASVVAPVWRLVRMPARCCLWVPRSAIWPCCRKAKSRLPTACTRWSARWTSWALVAAPTPTPAKLNARNSSSGRTSQGSIGNGLGLCLGETENKRIAHSAIRVILHSSAIKQRGHTHWMCPLTTSLKLFQL